MYVCIDRGVYECTIQIENKDEKSNFNVGDISLFYCEIGMIEEIDCSRALLWF